MLLNHLNTIYVFKIIETLFMWLNNLNTIYVFKIIGILFMFLNHYGICEIYMFTKDYFN